MKRGFTLIELLVVIAIIAIIGILASIVLVSTNGARAKATNVRIQAEVAQVRSALERGFANNSYLDIVGSAGHNDDMSTTGPSMTDITVLLCAIGKQSGYPTNVTGDISLTCDGIPSLHSGVLVYSNSTAYVVRDYGIYASTTPGGYICTDSFGNSKMAATGSIPTFVSISSPTTALCQ